MCTPPVAKHVLVVDDYPDLAEMLAELLREASLMRITTDVGFDGAQAVALAVSHPPQVALLDIDMPVMNGVEAARAIRSRLGLACPFLIAVTGQPGHLMSSSAAGAFDRVLTKPVDIDQVVELLTEG